jgi:hypothetical protein
MPYIIQKPLKMRFQLYMTCLIWEKSEYSQPFQGLLSYLMARLIWVGKVKSGTLK